MKIEEFREIANKRNEGHWHETPGMSTNWHEYTEEFEEALKSHIDALLDVVEAALEHLPYIASGDLFGAGKYSEHNVSAHKLREALKKLEEV